MSCLVSHGKYIGVRTQHIRDTCVFETVELVSVSQIQARTDITTPVISERLFCSSFLSWSEIITKEKILSWTIEDAQVYH